MNTYDDSEGVRHHPWVGDDYSDKGFGGVRILALGESHYLTDGYTLKQKDKATSTQEDITRVIKGELTGLFFNRVVALVRHAANQKDMSDAEIWHSIAFYNYVQDFMDDSRTRPNKDQWKSAEKPFLAVVDRLQPDMVLVLGATMWHKMPNGDGKVCAMRKHPRHPKSSSAIYLYGNAIAAYVNHPSQIGWSFDLWKPVGRELFKRAAKNRKASR